jgi:hypothetical protein
VFLLPTVVWCVILICADLVSSERALMYIYTSVVSGTRRGFGGVVVVVVVVVVVGRGRRIRVGCARTACGGVLNLLVFLQFA